MSAFSKQNLQSRHGLLMTAEETAVVVGAMSWRAYRYAKQAASQGYSPEDSARWGTEIATFQVLFWCCSVSTSVLAFPALSQGGFLTLWAMGHFLFIAAFACRLTALRRTPPNQTRVYPWFLKTSSLLVACALWALITIPIGLVMWGNATQHQYDTKALKAPQGQTVVQDTTDDSGLCNGHACQPGEVTKLANQAANQRLAEERAMYCTPQWAGNPNVPAGLCPGTTNGTD